MFGRSIIANQLISRIVTRIEILVLEHVFRRTPFKKETGHPRAYVDVWLHILHLYMLM